MSAQAKKATNIKRIHSFHLAKHSRKRIRLSKKTDFKNVFLKKFIIVLLIILPLFILLVFISFHSKYWNGKEKLSVAVFNREEGVDIITFDPTRGEVSEVLIPSDTLSESARGLGSWRLKSIWQLGENEGIGGQLLAETITRYFKIPVYVWGDATSILMEDRSLLSLLKVVTFHGESNLGVVDRLRLALFNIKVPANKRSKVDLSKTNYLKDVDLPDEGKGWIVSGKLPSELLGIFSLPEIANNSLTVEIRDGMERSDISQEIGEVIEVLGAKVVAINNESQYGGDCEIWGTNKLLNRKIIELFSCRDMSDEQKSSFDLTIKLGRSFAERY